MQLRRAGHTPTQTIAVQDIARKGLNDSSELKSELKLDSLVDTLDKVRRSAPDSTAAKLAKKALAHEARQKSNLGFGTEKRADSLTGAAVAISNIDETKSSSEQLQAGAVAVSKLDGQALDGGVRALANAAVILGSEFAVNLSGLPTLSSKQVAEVLADSPAEPPSSKQLSKMAGSSVQRLAQKKLSLPQLEAEARGLKDLADKDFRKQLSTGGDTSDASALHTVLDEALKPGENGPDPTKLVATMAAVAASQEQPENAGSKLLNTLTPLCKDHSLGLEPTLAKGLDTLKKLGVETSVKPVQSDPVEELKSKLQNSVAKARDTDAVQSAGPLLELARKASAETDSSASKIAVTLLEKTQGPDMDEGEAEARIKIASSLFAGPEPTLNNALSSVHINGDTAGPLKEVAQALDKPVAGALIDAAKDNWSLAKELKIDGDLSPLKALEVVGQSAREEFTSKHTFGSNAEKATKLEHNTKKTLQLANTLNNLAPSDELDYLTDRLAKSLEPGEGKTEAMTLAVSLPEVVNQPKSERVKTAASLVARTNRRDGHGELKSVVARWGNPVEKAYVEITKEPDDYNYYDALSSGMLQEPVGENLIGKVKNLANDESSRGLDALFSVADHLGSLEPTQLKTLKAGVKGLRSLEINTERKSKKAAGNALASLATQVEAGVTDSKQLFQGAAKAALKRDAAEDGGLDGARHVLLAVAEANQSPVQTSLLDKPFGYDSGKHELEFLANASDEPTAAEIAAPLTAKNEAGNYGRKIALDATARITDAVLKQFPDHSEKDVLQAAGDYAAEAGSKKGEFRDKDLTDMAHSVTSATLTSGTEAGLNAAVDHLESHQMLGSPWKKKGLNAALSFLGKVADSKGENLTEQMDKAQLMSAGEMNAALDTQTLEESSWDNISNVAQNFLREKLHDSGSYNYPSDTLKEVQARLEARQDAGDDSPEIASLKKSLDLKSGGSGQIGAVVAISALGDGPDEEWSSRVTDKVQQLSAQPALAEYTELGEAAQSVVSSTKNPEPTPESVSEAQPEAEKKSLWSSLNPFS